MLTVYGATGYTGKLIVDALVGRGQKITIAGRNAEKLHALRESIAARGKAPPDIAIAALDDRRALYELAKRSRVVLSAAGPYKQMGPPVIEACLDGGAHYLDVTGEVRFMVATALRDREAKNANVALVNAVGFDVVPTDLCAHLAARGLGGDAPPDEVDVAVAISGGQPSGGTLRSLLDIARDSGLRYEHGRWVEEAIAADRKRFDFPEVGSSDAFSMPLGDVATAPRTTGAKRTRAYVRLPAIVARAMAIAVRPGRAILKSPIGALVSSIAPPAGDGPSEGERRRTRFSIVAEARRGADVARATMAGRDPYGLTAECAAEIAVALSEAGYGRSGALSPMNALDPARWRALLEKLGCTIIAGA